MESKFMRILLALLFVAMLINVSIAQVAINVSISSNSNIDIIVLEKGNKKIQIQNDTASVPTGGRYVFNTDNGTREKYFLVLASPSSSSSNPISLPVDGVKQPLEIFNSDGNWFSGPVKGSIAFPLTVSVKEGSDQGNALKTVVLMQGSSSEPTAAGGSSRTNLGSHTQIVKATGIPYYDALSLSRHASLSLSSIEEILQYYNHESSSVDTAAIIKAYQHNPFLKDSVSKFLRVYSGARLQGALGLSFLPSALSSLGGLDVTNLADGMAKFLVARTKQELASAFFNHFKEVLADSEFKDLRTLFPVTCTTLNAIGDQIYNYDAYIQALRESFEKDLSQLSENLPGIIDNYPDYFTKHKGMAAMLRSACYIGGELNDGQHPGQILRDYPVYFLDSLNRNWQGAIRTLQLVSESLRDTSKVTDSTSYWVSPNKIASFVSDSAVFKIYLGLLYQQAVTSKDSVKFEGGWTLCRILDTVAVHFSSYYGNYKDYFADLAMKENKLTRMLASYKKTTNDSVAIEQFYGYAMATMDFFEAAADIGKLAPLGQIADTSAIKTFFRNAEASMDGYFTVARSAVNIIWDVKRRSYAAAIVNAVTIYNYVVVDTAKAELGAVKSKILSWTGSIFAKGNSTQAEQDSLKKVVASLESQIGSLGPILRYGTFMATIVQAKNSDEVESAIEAFALPAGSYRTKRESCFAVELNAYVGGFMGYEAVRGKDRQLFGSGFYATNSYGLTAPIGVSLSTSSCGWSFSGFISLVDIGAVAAFRFNSDSTSQIPTVHLADIVSPGLLVSIGIPSCPISVNFGVQMGPNLHSVSSTVNNYSGAVYYRYSASVCVDIPILDFYTKPK
jgi:hypothetical protein